MKKICAHCKQRFVNRPRGLCFSCYYKPGVRERYTSGSKFARRGIGLKNENSKPATMPTIYICGSEEKIAVMRGRVERGETLFHPDDNPVKCDRLLVREWMCSSFHEFREEDDPDVVHAME